MNKSFDGFPSINPEEMPISHGVMSAFFPDVYKDAESAEFESVFNPKRTVHKYKHQEPINFSVEAADKQLELSGAPRTTSSYEENISQLRDAFVNESGETAAASWEEMERRAEQFNTLMETLTAAQELPNQHDTFVEGAVSALGEKIEALNPYNWKWLGWTEAEFDKIVNGEATAYSAAVTSLSAAPLTSHYYTAGAATKLSNAASQALAVSGNVPQTPWQQVISGFQSTAPSVASAYIESLPALAGGPTAFKAVSTANLARNMYYMGRLETINKHLNGRDFYDVVPKEKWNEYDLVLGLVGNAYAATEVAWGVIPGTGVLTPDVLMKHLTKGVTDASLLLLIRGIGGILASYIGELNEEGIQGVIVDIGAKILNSIETGEPIKDVKLANLWNQYLESTGESAWAVAGMSAAGGAVSLPNPAIANQAMKRNGLSSAQRAEVLKSDDVDSANKLIKEYQGENARTRIDRAINNLIGRSIDQTKEDGSLLSATELEAAVEAEAKEQSALVLGAISSVTSIRELRDSIFSSEHVTDGTKEILSDLFERYPELLDIETGVENSEYLLDIKGKQEKFGNRLAVHKADGRILFNSDEANNASMMMLASDLIHELGHPLSKAVLIKAGILDSGTSEDWSASLASSYEAGTITDAEHSAIKDLISVYDQTKGSLGTSLAAEYALSNLHEFVGEVLGNPLLRDEMSEVIYDDGRSLIQVIYDAIKALFVGGKESTTLKDVAFKSIFDVADQTNKINEQLSEINPALAEHVSNGNKDAQLLINDQWAQRASLVEIQAKIRKIFGDSKVASEVYDDIVHTANNKTAKTIEDTKVEAQALGLSYEGGNHRFIADVEYDLINDPITDATVYVRTTDDAAPHFIRNRLVFLRAAINKNDTEMVSKLRAGLLHLGVETNDSGEPVNNKLAEELFRDLGSDNVEKSYAVDQFMKPDSIEKNKSGVPNKLYHLARPWFTGDVDASVGRHIGYHVGTRDHVEALWDARKLVLPSDAFAGYKVNEHIINVSNPLRVNDGGGRLSKWVQNAYLALKKENPLHAERFRNAIEDTTKTSIQDYALGNIGVAATDDAINKVVRDELLSYGYDGIVYNNKFERNEAKDKYSKSDDSYIIIDNGTIRYASDALNDGVEDLGANPKPFISQKLYDAYNYLDGVDSPVNIKEMSLLKSGFANFIKQAEAEKIPLTQETVNSILATGEINGKKIPSNLSDILSASVNSENSLDFIRQMNTARLDKGQTAIFSDAELRGRVQNNFNYIEKAIRSSKELNKHEKARVLAGMYKAAETMAKTGFKVSPTEFLRGRGSYVKGVGQGSIDAMQAALYAADGKEALGEINRIRVAGDENGKGIKRVISPLKETISQKQKTDILNSIPKKKREGNERGLEIMSALNFASPSIDTSDQEALALQGNITMRMMAAKKIASSALGRTLTHLADMRYYFGTLANSVQKPEIFDSYTEFMKENNRHRGLVDHRLVKMFANAGVSKATLSYLASNKTLQLAMKEFLYYNPNDTQTYQYKGKKKTGKRLHAEAKAAIEAEGARFEGTLLPKAKDIFAILDAVKGELSGQTMMNQKINFVVAFGRALEGSVVIDGRRVTRANAYASGDASAIADLNKLLPSYLEGGQLQRESLEEMAGLWADLKTYGNAYLYDTLLEKNWGRESYWMSSRAATQSYNNDDVYQSIISYSPIQATKKGARRESNVGPMIDVDFISALEKHVRSAEILANTWRSGTALQDSVSKSGVDNTQLATVQDWMRKQVGTYKYNSTEVASAKVIATGQKAFWMPWLLSHPLIYNTRNILFQSVHGWATLGGVDGAIANVRAIKNMANPNSKVRQFIVKTFAPSELSRVRIFEEHMLTGQAFSAEPSKTATDGGLVKETAKLAGAATSTGLSAAASWVGFAADSANRINAAMIYYQHASDVVDNLLGGKIKVKKAWNKLRLENMRAEEEQRLFNLFLDGVKSGKSEGFDAFLEEYAITRNLSINFEYRTSGKSTAEQDAWLRASLGPFTYRKGNVQQTITSSLQPIHEALINKDARRALIGLETLAKSVLVRAGSGELYRRLYGKKIIRMFKHNFEVNDYGMFSFGGSLGLPVLGAAGRIVRENTTLAYKMMFDRENMSAKDVSRAVYSFGVFLPLLIPMARTLPAKDGRVAEDNLLYLWDKLTNDRTSEWTSRRNATGKQLENILSGREPVADEPFSTELAWDALKSALIGYRGEEEEK